jgi:dolichyl-phosphate-mannose-protein mannosyltransferase
MSVDRTQPRSRTALVESIVDIGIALAIAMVFYLLVSRDLTRFTSPIFDEVYTFPAVREILAGLAPHEQTHPPLSKLIMSFGYWLVAGASGNDPGTSWVLVTRGARLLSPLAGSIALVGLYALVKGIEDRRAALIATLLLACDGVFVLMSRLALTNIYAEAFTLLGLASLWRATKSQQLKWLYVAGLAFGLGSACRWTSGLSLAAAIAWLVMSASFDRMEPQRRWAAHGVLALVVLPIFTYVATYAQTLLANAGGRWDLVFSSWGIDQIIQLHKFALGSHVGVIHHHICESAWWTWPLVLRPVWMIFAFHRETDSVVGIFDGGNVFIWWLALPAIAWAAYRGYKGDRAMALLALLALATWLPWSVVHSKQMFIHYFFESVPPVCAILGISLSRLVKHCPSVRWVPYAYVGLVAAWLAYFAPLILGTPISTASYASHLWLGAENWDMANMTQQFRVANHLEDKRALEQYLNENFPTMDEVKKKYDLLVPSASGSPQLPH